MTDDLNRNGGDAMVDTNDVNVVGETGRETLVGQAAGAVEVSAPAQGETVNVTLVKGQTANLAFDATAATPIVEGNDFVLTFDTNGDGEADSRIVFQNLVEESQGADAPVLVIGGVELSAGLLIGQAQALAEGETLETAAGAGAGPAGGGGSVYSDDLGNAIDLLNAQGVIDPTELQFGLLEGQDEITDPAQGTLLISFLTTVTEVEEGPDGGITGSFGGGFEDWLPNHHLDGGDVGEDSSPFLGDPDGTREAFSAPMRMVLTFVPSDNETLDSVVINELPEGVRLFIGGSNESDEYTGGFPVTVSPSDFEDIYVLPPQHSDADITITGTATISDPDSGESATLGYTTVAIIDAVADRPDDLRIGDDGGENGQQTATLSDVARAVSPSGGVVNSGDEEDVVTIPVTVEFADFADDSEAHELVIDGVPEGWDIRPIPGAEIWQMDGDNVYQVTFDTDGKPVLTLVTDISDLPASLQHQIALASGVAPSPGALNTLENTIGDEVADDGYVRYFIDVSENVDDANGGNTADTSDDGSGSLTTNISFNPNDWTNDRLPDGTPRDGGEGGESGDQGGPATITVHAVATETVPEGSGAELTDADGTPVDENNQAVAGPVSVDISIDEDIPEFTSPITLIHDETQRTVSSEGVGVDPDSNDIPAVPADVQAVLDARYKVLKADDAAELGDAVGQAQNSFTYDLKTDGSNDETDGSDGSTDTDAPLNTNPSIPDDLEAITFDLTGDVASGLTSGGSIITLHQDPDQPQVVWGLDESGNVVFAVHIDGSLVNGDGNTGNLTFVQYGPIDHNQPGDGGEGSHDENTSFDLPIKLTDDEGDSVTATATINIEDDGPVITKFETNDGVEIRLDESVGFDPADGNADDESAVGASAYAIGYAKIAGTDLIDIAVDAGTDGEKSRVFSLTLDSSISGLFATASGDPVYLSQVGNVIAGVADGETVFTITVDPATGGITVEQFGALKHGDTDDHDEASNPLEIAAGAIKLTVTLTDGDDDTDSESVELGNLIKFEDDGPVVDVAVKTVGEGEDAEPVTLSLNALDESIGTDTGDSNAASDDTGNTVSDPTGSNAIGSITSGVNSGALGNLFNITKDAGTDGEKSVEYKFELTLEGTPDSSGGIATNLNVTQGTSNTDYVNTAIYLFLEGGEIVGRFDATAGANGLDGIAFRISLDDINSLTNADLTFDQYVAISHPDGTPADHDEAINLLTSDSGASVGLKLTTTVTDGDDDTATDSATVVLFDDENSSISIEDDGPVVDVAVKTVGQGEDAEAATLSLDTLDESTGADAGDPNAASDDTGNTVSDPTGSNAIGSITSGVNNGALGNLFNITKDAGTDGEKSVEHKFELTLEGTPGSEGGIATNLSVTQGTSNTDYVDTAIYLFLEGGEIVGRFDATAGANGLDGIAFRISLDDVDSLTNADLTFDQYVAISHPDGTPADHDEAINLLTSDSGASVGLKLTTTVTDGDDDTATDSATVVLFDNENSSISIEDDGPSVTSTGPQEFVLNGSFEDGHTLSGATYGTFNSLSDGSWSNGGAGQPGFEIQHGNIAGTAQHGDALLELDANENSVAQQDIAGMTAGEDYVLTFHYKPRVNNGTDTDDVIVKWNGVVVEDLTSTDAPGGWKQFTVTVTAGAGTNNLAFEGDGNSESLGGYIDNISINQALIVDETDLGVNDSLDFSGRFTADFGSDGQGAPTTYAITAIGGIDSGLVDTISGKPVLLYDDGAGTVVGRVGGIIGEDVFKVTVDGNGVVTLDQIRAVRHPDADNHDDVVGIPAGKINLTATVTDGDGDTADSTIDLGTSLYFKDDGPVNTIGTVSGTVEEDNLVDGNDEDGAGSTVANGSVAGLVDFGSDGAASGGGFSLASDLSNLPTLTSNGLAVTYAVSGDTLTASTTAGSVFTLKVESDGSYTFTLLDQLDHHPVNAADNSEGFLDLDLSSVIVATDRDGDSVTVDDGFVIRVQDDVPVALDDVLNVTDESAGNVVTGNLLQAGESAGADQPGTIREITHDGVTYELAADGQSVSGGGSFDPATGVLTITTKAGATLTVDMAGDNLGDYSYEGPATHLGEDFALGGGSFDGATYTQTNPATGVTVTLTGAGTQGGNPVDVKIVASEFSGLGIANVPQGSGDSTAIDDGGVAESVTISFSDAGGTVSSDYVAINLGSIDDASTGEVVAWSAETASGTVTGTTSPGDTLLELDLDGITSVTLTAVGDNFTVVSVSTAPDTLDETFDYVLEDADGDQDGATLTVTVADDNPVADIEFNQDAEIRLDETENDDDDTAVDGLLADVTILGSNLFTDSSVFGADGAASAGATEFSLNIEGRQPLNSGLVDAQTDESIILTQEPGGDVVGSSASGGEVFRISVNPSNGNVTVTQTRAVEHNDSNDPDEASSPEIMNSGILNLVATVTDADGDQSVDTLDLGSVIKFEDDGPVLTAVAAAADSLQVDDTTLNVNDTTDFSGLFTADAGEDGSAGITYALSVPSAGVDSGIVDTATGQKVVLTDNNGVIEGRTETGGDLVFTVSVDSDGKVTLDQVRAVDHGADGNDHDSEISLASGSVILTGTLTDGDGDTDDATVDLSGAISFKDDGPVLTAVAAAADSLQVDDTTLNVNDTTDFSGLFTADAGEDGSAGITYALSVPSAGVDSGIVDTATGQKVVLTDNNGVIEGRTETGGDLVFTVSVNSDGEVTLDQVRAVDHGADGNDHDSEISLASGSVILTGTLTDGDGDTDDATVDLSGAISFKDDGPSANLSVKDAAEIRLDETDNDSDDNDVGGLLADVTVAGSALFANTSAFGSDGAAVSNATVYSLTLNGAQPVTSGLLDAVTNEPITLSQSTPGGVITGSSATGGTVFTVSIDPVTGSVTVQQSRAIEHDDINDPIEDGTSSAVMTSGLIEATVTVTDGDGDSHSDDAELGNLIKFEDDGPAFTVLEDSSLDESIDPVTSVNFVDHGDGLKVDIVNEGLTQASYQNTFGYYFFNAAGEPMTGTIVAESVTSTTPVGDLVGSVTFDTATDVPAGATGMGFFLIPNGLGQNPAALIQEGQDVTFSQVGGEWVAFVNGTQLQGSGGADALFDNQALNPNNKEHLTDLTNVAGNQNWEDINVGGDNDYDDANLTVTVKEVATGTVLFNAGSDGLQSLAIEAVGAKLDTAANDYSVTTALESGGQAIVASAATSAVVDGETIWTINGTIDGGATPVYSFTYNQDTGKYIFEQFAPIDHFDGANPIDILDLGFKFTVTDNDGDSVAHIITVQVNDDTLLAVDDAGTVTEGTTLLVTSANGVLSNDDFGVDGQASPAITGVRAGDETGAEPTGSVGTPIVGSHGTLTLNADGSYTYVANGNLDNENPITDTFSYTITDGDGDTDVAELVITINDGGIPTVTDPSGGPLALSVSEVNLPSDVDDGTITFQAGSDDIVAVEFDGTNDPSIAGIDESVTWSLSGDGLTWTGSDSEGVAIVLTVSGGTATAGNTGTATVTVTLSDELKHDLGGGSIDISGVNVVATDTDGDTASAPVTVAVVDDVPLASDDTGSVTEGATLSVTSANGVLSNDDFGADGQASPAITGVRTGDDTGAEPSGSVGTQIVGSYGTLTLNADGSYSYAANGNLNNASPLTDTFSYTITDGDGDTDVAELVITINDGGIPTVTDPSGGPLALSVSEVNLPSDIDDGTITFQAGSDDIVTVEFDGTNDPSIAGIDESVTWSLSGDGLTWTGSDSEGVAIVLTVSGGTATAGNTGTATVTVTLSDELKHDLGGGSIDISGVNVVATDTDGDTASAPVTVAVVDDVPLASDDTGSVTEGATLSVTSANGVLSNDDFGADGQASPAITGVRTGDDTGAEPSGSVGTQIVGSYGTLTLNADGSYTYVANGNLDNENPITDTFSYTITDGDGDTDVAELVITINDGGIPTVTDPSGGPLALSVSEVNLPSDVDDGTITFQAGSDDIVAVEFDGTNDPSIAGIDESVTWSLSGDGLTWTGSDSEGVAIVLTVSGGTATAGNTGTATVTVTLSDELKHDLGGGSIDISGVNVVATDTDGDTASA
ncbi:DUF5801 repeats-in-toxin domain-containing protein, partial [Kiloniella litopenaei]|uniref:DUF5801 repeats-in-toxin domain-containing protein n=1 Tax=Kiloniella litopenaei TaxID=1549748 RepID=UPI003BAAB726